MPLTLRTPRFVRAAFFTLSVTLFGVAAHAQVSTLRVAAWNVTNYTSSVNTARDNAFKTALYATFQGRSFAPDVLIGQEFNSAAAATRFLDVLNTAPGSPGDWAASAFTSGSDAVCFYRTSKATLNSITVVSAAGTGNNPPRSTPRYDLTVKGATAAANAPLSIYGSHFKAGNESLDRTRRLTEAQRIRDDAQTLGANANFLLAGDLNLYTSNEAAFQELTGSQSNNAGRFLDPIATPGDWNNQSAFRFVHTQDPSTAMDDRFDFLLLSGGLADGSGLDYLGRAGTAYSTTTWNDPNHSYRAWGNDGSSYNTQLRITGNAMVGSAIAQALVDSTGFDGNGARNIGHLPVFLDLRVAAVPGPAALMPFTIGAGFLAARLRQRKS